MKIPKGLVLVAVQALVSSVSAGSIVVGQVAPLSGLDAYQGRAYSAGMQLCFSLTNKLGGVNGHTFALVRKDDAGKPRETLAGTRQLLVESQPLVLAGYFGNRNIDELVASGILVSEKIALVGYRVSEVRSDSPLLFGVRAGLREEVQKFAEHVTTIGMTRVGLVFDDSPNAPALIGAMEDATSRSGAKLIAKVSSTRMEEAVANMQAAPLQAIFIATGGAAAAKFIEQYRSAGGAAQLFAQSGADLEQLSKRLGDEQMQGLAIMQVTPNPYQIRSRLAKEFTDAASTSGLEVPVSYTMMEGFIACKVIVEAARRQGAHVSREGMAAALNSMSSYDLGGYLISYKPGMRSGSQRVELSIISSNGKIRQ
jgi:branched-chain amino acid transport system substrate-binding protein